MRILNRLSLYKVYAHDLLKMVTCINESEKALHSAFGKRVGVKSGNNQVYGSIWKERKEKKNTNISYYILN
jgi:precorrin-4 methylase